MKVPSIEVIGGVKSRAVYRMGGSQRVCLGVWLLEEMGSTYSHMRWYKNLGLPLSIRLTQVARRRWSAREISVGPIILPKAVSRGQQPQPCLLPPMAP